MDKNDSISLNGKKLLHLTDRQTQNVMEHTLLTLDEIFEKYPAISTELKWTKEDVEVFVDSHILIGHFSDPDENGNKKLLILEESFLLLLDYRRKVGN